MRDLSRIIGELVGEEIQEEENEERQLKNLSPNKMASYWEKGTYVLNERK